MDYRCIRRYRDSKTKKTMYVLNDDQGRNFIASRDSVISLLKQDSNSISNLRLSSNNRVLFSNGAYQDQLKSSALDFSERHNIDAYVRYANKIKILGYPSNRQWVKCDVREAEDRVVLEYVNICDDTIEIPQFVTDIDHHIFRNHKGRQLKVIHKGNQIKDIQYMFANLLISYIDLQEFDTTGIDYAVGVFQNCPNLKKVDIQHLDFSNVVLLTGCFQGCVSLEQVNLPKNLSNCQQTIEMFEECKRLKNLDLNGTDFQQLMSLNRMFESSGLTRFKTAGIKFRTICGISGLFQGCRDLLSCDLSSLTLEQCKTINGVEKLFNQCERLKEVRLMPSFGRQQSLQQMFNECLSLREIHFPDCRGLTIRNVHRTFRWCKSLRVIDLGGLDFSNVEIAQDAFRDCRADLSDLLDTIKLSSCTNVDFMFQGCRFMRHPVDFQKLNTVNVKTCYGFLSETSIYPGQNIYFQTNKCEALCACFQNQNIQQIDFSKYDLHNAKNINSFAASCKNLKYVNIRGANMSKLTSAAVAFYDCINLVKFVTDTLETFAKTHNLMNLISVDDVFHNCAALKKPDFSAYKFIGQLNVSKVFD